MQIPARTPAMTAMTAATLDTLSGGRFRLGLGVSGPQVSEGWHGVRFDKPLGRTREYVEIVRTAMRRETLAYAGRALHAAAAGRPGQGAEADRAPGPRAGPGLPGRGRAEEPRAGRRDRRRRAAALLRAERAGDFLDPVRAGRAKAGLGLDGFDVVRDLPGLDRRRPAGLRRPGPRRTPRSTSAAWAPGSRTSTTSIARRMGFEAEARQVQDLYLDRKQREAAAAVPYEFIDRTVAARAAGADRRPAGRAAPRPGSPRSTSRRTGDGRGPDRRRCASLVGAVERAGVA